MRLVGMRVRNFRCFGPEFSVPLAPFTAIVGRNEAGKSSLLEALAIFFGEQKIDADDVNKHMGSTKVEITCQFDDLPPKLVLDADHETSLAAEQLLNADGQFEVRKTFDLTKKTPSQEIHAIGHMANDAQVIDLMGLKIAALKRRFTELGLPKEGVNLSISSEIRQGIRAAFLDKPKGSVAVSLEEEAGKDVWKQIEPHLPVFALFKADRPSTDQDDEAQDPMVAAVKEAVAEQAAALEAVTASVRNRVMSIASATVAKLGEVNRELASEITPLFAPSEWHKIFKISLASDSGIALNKRGSGVRRLILLSFFRARAEEQARVVPSKALIYAVEEPETSQHPDHQRLLAQALQELADSGNRQVLITTHTPGLARTLAVESLRYVRVGADGNRELLAGGDVTYRAVCNALGVHRDHRVALFIVVEGHHDTEFLKRLSGVLSRAGEAVADLSKAEDEGRVVFVLAGGGNLVYWATRLQPLNVPEFHLYDGGAVPNPKWVDAIAQVNAHPPSTGRLTKRKEIENYLHKDAIAAGCEGMAIAFGYQDSVPTALAKAKHDAHVAPDKTPWDQLTEEDVREKVARAKHRLNRDAVDQMTAEWLTAVDPDAEVRGWFAEITARLAVVQ